MHRALWIPEVVAMIVEHTKLKHCIFALAQTCHTFTEPALDALWKVPPLWYLAKTMSDNLWTIETSDVKLPLGFEDSDYNEARRTLVRGRATRFCFSI
jgi:hypothetical protein